MGKCPHGKKSVPINKRLYSSVKKKVKARAKVWPSAYASGQLVREYKSRGGKYKCAFGSLDRWFKEKWVNVCKSKRNGKYPKCGRSKSSRKGYPYCRPSKRVNGSTPKTVHELSRSTLKRMCSRKQKSPYKKLGNVSSEKKNNFGSYTMNKEPQTCGYGKPKFGGLLGNITKASKLIKKHGNTVSKNIKKGKEAYNKNKEAIKELKQASKEAYNNVTQSLCEDNQKFDPELKRCVNINSFGYNIGPTDSNLDSFYKNGTANSSNYTKNAIGCMSKFYNEPVTRFGKKKFIQEANERSRRKGTVGSFKRWCKRQGYSKVTTACINRGKRSKSLTTRRRAVFAQNIRPKKKSAHFGDCGCKRQSVQFGKSKNLKSVNSDIVYLRK
jgi:hypothetical protein